MMAPGASPDVPLDDETRAEEQRLADALRRVLNRIVLVRPTAEQLRTAADQALAFADHLDTLPARLGDGVISEAGLRPNDHLRHSPLAGTANAVAPPVTLWKQPDPQDAELAWTTEGHVTFDAAYEGPPGHVHGGFVAAMFDELLGRSQASAGFTKFITVTYHLPTPLRRELSLRGWVDRVEGRKRWIKGTCHLDGVLLTEGEGLFIAPRGGAGPEAITDALARRTAGGGGPS